MEIAKLTVQLPRQDLEFAKEYARLHRTTVTGLIDRYLNRLWLRSGVKIRPQTAESTSDAWQELFRLGDALAAEDGPETETLTSAVLSMRFGAGVCAGRCSGGGSSSGGGRIVPAGGPVGMTVTLPARSQVSASKR